MIQAVHNSLTVNIMWLTFKFYRLHDRMPVILPDKAAADTWLSEKNTFPAGYVISSLVNHILLLH